MQDELGCQSRKNHWEGDDFEMEEDQDGAGRTSFERTHGILSHACGKIAVKRTHCRY